MRLDPGAAPGAAPAAVTAPSPLLRPLGLPSSVVLPPEVSAAAPMSAAVATTTTATATATATAAGTATATAAGTGTATSTVESRPKRPRETLPELKKEQEDVIDLPAQPAQISIRMRVMEEDDIF